MAIHSIKKVENETKERNFLRKTTYTVTRFYIKPGIFVEISEDYLGEEDNYIFFLCMEVFEKKIMMFSMPKEDCPMDMWEEIIENNINEYIPSNLKSVREMKEMTQKELAEKSGINIRMIEHYEQGSKNIRKASAETVYHLAKALECDMEDLLDDIPEET